jgi:hypothetical protein
MKPEGKESLLHAIPDFSSENEEREFWATHDSTEYLDWDQAVLVVFPNLKPSAHFPGKSRPPDDEQDADANPPGDTSSGR